MKIKVTSAKGAATSKEVSLSKEVFGIEPNDHAIYLDVSNTWQIVVKERTKQKKELRFQVLLRKLRNKKVQVEPVLVVLSQVLVEVVDVFSDHAQETITSN